MDRYKALLQEKADIIKEAEAILAKADLTDEDRKRDDEISAKLEAINGDLARFEKIRDAKRNEPAAETIVLQPEAKGGWHDRAADKPWQGFGEFLQAVASASSPGGVADPRLFQAAASGASSGVPSDGGFLVGTDYSTMLLNRAIENAVLAPLCTPITIGAGSDGIDLPFIDETSRANGSRWGGVQVYWRGEADTVTATKPKFGQHDIRLQELMGLAYATERLLRDSTALESILSIAFASEMAFKLDDAIFRGNGAGLPLGITNSSGPRVQVAKETGQKADTVVEENIKKMWVRIPPRSKARGIWLINTEVSPELDSLSQAIGTSGVPSRVVTYSEAGAIRIKGRPVVEIEQCSALGDEGDIVFADLSEYLLIRKGGIEAAQSMHVRFIYGENTYRWTMRVNGKPAWDSAMTIYKTNTSTTQSPFVTLAARA